MANNERMLYQNNNLGYFFVIGYIVLNTIYTFFILNVMEKDSGIGIFVMLSIVLLLLGFLMAIKVRIYSLIWSVITIITGVFQFIRIFFTQNNLDGALAIGVDIILIISGIICVSGGLISVKLTKIRRSLK